MVLIGIFVLFFVGLILAVEALNFSSYTDKRVQFNVGMGLLITSIICGFAALIWKFCI